MLYVALAESAVLVVVVASFCELLRSQSRAHARTQADILNKLLHAVGNPWQTAPAHERPRPVGDQGRESAHDRYTTNPEQEP